MHITVTLLHNFLMRKTFLRKRGSNGQNLKQILRKSLENHEAQFRKFSVFIGQKSIFRHYCIQNFKDRIQIQVYNINNEIVNHFGQFILVKVKKNLRKSQAR